MAGTVLASYGDALLKPIGSIQVMVESPGYVFYEGQFVTATCDNPASPRHSDKVQPNAACDQRVK